MPTPSIQTLRADAQQVLNLDSISAVRSVVAATLANANAGTPLNPNLTTQQLWNEFYQIVTQPKSDIESIIANQLMKFLFAPPAPGGAGADKQVIFNDGGVLAGDTGLTFNKTTDLLTVGSLIVPGNVQLATVSTLYVGTLLNPKLKVDVGGTGVTTITEATITGDLTVRTTGLTTTSSAVGINTASPTANTLTIGASRYILCSDSQTKFGDNGLIGGGASDGNTQIQFFGGKSLFFNEGVSNRMTLNANGLGLGVTPSAWNSSYRALQVGATGALWQSASGFTFLSDNAFVNSGASNTYITTAAASFYRQTSGIHSWWNAPSGTAGNAITFTQAMTLDASGNLLVGSTLPVSGGKISGNSSTGPAGRFFSSAGDNQFAAMFDKSSATNTTSQWLIGFTINNQSTGSGQINANGANQAAFGTFSDSRLKENIASLTSQLSNILSLRPVEFDYKDGSGHQIGFVAQEMQEVYSDAVAEQNGFLTVTGWSKTEARLVSAIKELAAKVQTLEAKLA